MGDIIGVAKIRIDRSYGTFHQSVKERIRYPWLAGMKTGVNHHHTIFKD